MRIRWGWWLCVAVAAAVYGHTLGYSFHMDDTHTITDNMLIHSPHAWLQAWVSPEVYSYEPEHWTYRPFTSMVFAICWQVGKGATWPFHVVQALFLSLFAWAAARSWQILWQAPVLGVSGKKLLSDVELDVLAGFLACLIIIHPMMIESTVYPAAGSSLFCATFWMLALHSYLRWRRDRRPGGMLAAIAFFALSGLAKEEGVTLPAVLCLIEWYALAGNFRATPTGQRLAKTVPFWGAFVGLVITYQVFKPAERSFGAIGINSFQYLMTQLRAWIYYLGIIPGISELNADNLEFGFSSTLADARVWMAAGLLAAMGWLAWGVRKRTVAGIVGLAWFVIAVSPTSSVVPLAEPVNDRRMVIGLIGILGALLPFGWMWVKSWPLTMKANQRALAAAALVLALAAAGNALRIRFWVDEEALWAETFRQNPSSGRALNNAAEFQYLVKEKYDDALRMYTKCEEIAPLYSVCKINKGIVYDKLGQDENAEKLFQNAISLRPDSPFTRHFLIEFLKARGRFSEALKLSAINIGATRCSDPAELANYKYFEEELQLAPGRAPAAAGEEVPGCLQADRAAGKG